MTDGGESESLSEGWKVKHDGVTPGYLYVVADEIGPGDVRPHPHPVNAASWEWLPIRELKLELIEQTFVTDKEDSPTKRSQS